MTKRSFRSELKALTFALGPHPLVLTDPLASNVLKDLNQALDCCYVRKTRRNLIWGLLVGRSVDTFTVSFLSAKHERIDRWFNDRIIKICRSTNPLTTDPTLKADLLVVKDMRNDLFHNAGRLFNDSEIEEFMFKSTRCIQQLIRDL